MTAVEKYIKGLKNYKELGMDIDAAIVLAETVLLSLEKEQIIDAYNKSFELRDKPYSTAIKYYTETYSSGVSEKPTS